MELPFLFFILFPLIILPGCCGCNTTCCGWNQSGRPSTLTATFIFPDVVNPDCASQPTDIEVTLTYDEIGAFWKWTGEESRTCDLPEEDAEGNPQGDCLYDITDVEMICLDTNGLFRTTVTTTGSTDIYYHVDLTCDPISILFENVDIQTEGDCSVLLSLEITE